MGPLNDVKEPHLYAVIRALFGQPIANTRILTLTAVGINLCGLSGTAPLARGLATSRIEKIQKANVTKAWQKLAKYWINVGD